MRRHLADMAIVVVGIFAAALVFPDMEWWRLAIGATVIGVANRWGYTVSEKAR